MEVEERSLTETPTWALATVLSLMVASVFLFTKSVELFGEWLDKRKRKPLLPAFNKIKEELIIFGVLSLLLGHWSIFVARICVKSSVFGTKFYPCIPETTLTETVRIVEELIVVNNSKDANHHYLHRYCSKGYESFASYESLEQLHRLLFVLGMTHVTYSAVTIALAVFKIYSWRTLEDEAKSMALENAEDHTKLKRLCTFVVHHASHPWSQHKVLIWLLCFSRQFWNSINKFDYNALRFGFIVTHQLPMSYDFLNYMVRSMDEEFCDIVGISLPLWIYAIFCIFLDFHGSNIYFWLSFLPAIIIMIIGTKLHHIVVKLAVEIMDTQSYVKTQEFKVELSDEFFWFKKPRLLLSFIQFISFQNAFEMAMFLWSVWEIDGTSCFMSNPTFIVIRLAFGTITQVWCSFITFPLYVIITQMGSRYKRTVITERVRKSLNGWKKRVMKRRNSNLSVAQLSTVTSMPLFHNSDRYGFDSSRSTNRGNIRINSGIGDEGSRKRNRRWSEIDYEVNVGVLFTPRRSSLSEGEGVRGMYYSSDDYSEEVVEMDEEEEEDCSETSEARCFHLH